MDLTTSSVSAVAFLVKSKEKAPVFDRRRFNSSALVYQELAGSFAHRISGLRST